ncbi:unnamed protein product [Prunus armeniaca]
MTVSGSNDVLTLALGTPEHGGRVRGVGAGESLMEVVREETKRIEARAKETVLEAVRQEREILLEQFRQRVPNFDPNLLKKNYYDLSKIDLTPPLLALCEFVQTTLKPSNEMLRVNIPEEVFGYEHDTFILCEDILQFASMVEIGSTVIAVYTRYLFDYLKMANMVNLVGLVDPGQVSSQS